MRKMFFAGCIAVMMVVSCSVDDTAQTAERGTIGFNTFVNKSTRGASDDITTANITNFGVYGFITDATGLLFNNETVTGSGGSWTYTNTQYWTAGATYWFSAIAPTTSPNWTYDTNNTTAGGVITFTNADGKQDLLYAYSGEITCSDPVTQSAVPFTFDHLLARVKFSFTNAMGNENTTLVVKDVTITDADTKATCNVSAAQASRAWTLAADNTTGSLVFGDVLSADAAIANNETSATDHLYMIPQNKTYKLSFTVSMLQGDVEVDSWTHEDVVVPAVDMQSGYSYVFSAELNPNNVDPEEELKPIEFTVTAVTEWQEFEAATALTDY